MLAIIFALLIEFTKFDLIYLSFAFWLFFLALTSLSLKTLLA